MKFVIRLSFISLLLFLFQSCSKQEKEISLIKEVDQAQEMISSYKEGVRSLNEGDAFYAAKKFLDAELLFPQSEWAPKSALMASYSYYFKIIIQKQYLIYKGLLTHILRIRE